MLFANSCLGYKIGYLFIFLLQILGENPQLNVTEVYAKRENTVYSSLNPIQVS